MKRILAMVVAIVIIATLAAVSVSASNLCEKYGDIKKVPTDKAPKIDGVFDDVYRDNALRIDVTRDSKTAEDRSALGDIYGYAYMLFDENNLYVYVSVADANRWPFADYFTICPICGKQEGAGTGCEHTTEMEKAANMWDDDCVEFFVDWTNAGKTPSQYRISASGVCSRDWDTWNLGFTGAAYDNGSTYGVEFSIPLDSSAKGTELGIGCMIHSQNGVASSALGKFDETIAYHKNDADYGSAWESAYYDYIVLGDDATIIDNKGGGDDPLIIVNPGESNNQGGGNNNQGGGNNGGNNTKKPGTADPIVSVVIAAVASLGAAVVVKKTCFKK